MAGHSHWAGIKHKKGRADKERSKIFSKLSREITVAAKLGDKDPNLNPRLRTAIQAWIAVLNLGFKFGSLSPSFAATVISRESFENILDLSLSALPFLCFIPAQCECPAITN